VRTPRRTTIISAGIAPTAQPTAYIATSTPACDVDRPSWCFRSGSSGESTVKKTSSRNISEVVNASSRRTSRS
jgi:hypothetical protein